MNNLQGLIRVIFLIVWVAQCKGLLTDVVSDSSRIVVCSGSGYFDSVTPIITSNNKLAGVGLTCSSGFIKIEGQGKVPANRDQPYFFGRQPPNNNDTQQIQKTGICDDQSAISALNFKFSNSDVVTSFTITCKSLKNPQEIKNIPVISNNSSSSFSSEAVDVGCNNGGIIRGFQMEWKNEPSQILISMKVISCRQIKQAQEGVQCDSPNSKMDVSCQGIPNDCCQKLENFEDVHECQLAGQKNGIKAWYTKFELDNYETEICETTDDLTVDWFQIQSVSGACMDAQTANQALFSECTSSQSSWFRFIGDGEYRKLENGKHVGKCLDIQSAPPDSSGQILLPSFDVSPCDITIAAWKYSILGLQMTRQASPWARSADLSPQNQDEVMVLEFVNGTAMMRSQEQVESELAESFEGGPQSKSAVEQQPQIKDGVLPFSISDDDPPPSQIQLTPIETVGSWSDEIGELFKIINQVIFDTPETSEILKIEQSFLSQPNLLSKDQVLQGPAYCNDTQNNNQKNNQNNNGVNIACDNWGRVIVLEVDPKITNLTTREGKLSESIFSLPKLRNLYMSNLGLVGALPELINLNNDQNNDNVNNVQKRVIREMLLNNNSFSGIVPGDWSQLDSLVYLDLSSNLDDLQISESWLGWSFGVGTQINIDISQCNHNNFTCQSGDLLINRFTCLQSLCTQNDNEGNDSSSGTHIAAIIGSIIAAMVFFVVILLVLFAFVMRRQSKSSDSDILKIETQLAEGMKFDPEKGFSGQLTPSPYKSNDFYHKTTHSNEEPSLLERYLHDEGIVTWNTPPQYVVDWEIDFERDLKPRGTLGVGAMGTVQLAEWTNRANGNKQLVAVKIFSRYLQPIYKDAVEVLNQKLILREVEILMRVQHPNIVKCLGAILKPPHMGLVLEYMDVGNLDKYLHNICTAHPINDRDKLIIMKQIARALDHLHPSVVHRDLKPQNILINTLGEVKLSDFGLSKIRQLQDAGRASSLQVLGTAPYTSPEVFRANGLNVDDEKVDIYSLGIIMWEIWTLSRPWEGENMVAISYKVVNEGQRPQMPKIIHPRLKELIESCWEDEPQRRPSARDVQRMLEWMIEEINTMTPQKHEEIPEQQTSCSLDDDNSSEEICKLDSADHINVPADENHAIVNVTFIYSDGDTCDAEFDWRDSLLLLTDEINDYLGYAPDGDTSRFRLHRVVEIESEEPQVLEIDLKNISDTLQQHGFYTRNKIYVELLNKE